MNEPNDESIINAARLQDPEIGDDAIIAKMEWGYWIGSIYVSKADVAKSELIAELRAEIERLKQELASTASLANKADRAIQAIKAKLRPSKT